MDSALISFPEHLEHPANSFTHRRRRRCSINSLPSVCSPQPSRPDVRVNWCSYIPCEHPALCYTYFAKADLLAESTASARAVTIDTGAADGTGFGLYVSRPCHGRLGGSGCRGCECCEKGDKEVDAVEKLHGARCEEMRMAVWSGARVEGRPVHKVGHFILFRGCLWSHVAEHFPPPRPSKSIAQVRTGASTSVNVLARSRNESTSKANRLRTFKVWQWA